MEVQLDVHLQYGGVFTENCFSGMLQIRNDKYGMKLVGYPYEFLTSVKQKFNIVPCALYFVLLDNTDPVTVVTDDCDAYLSADKKSFALWKDGAFYCGPAANSQEALKLYEKEFQGKID